MRAPDFWTKGGPLSVLLAPLGWVWAVGSAYRGIFTTPQDSPIPVVCVGNLVVGGAGKTPVALSLAEHLPGAHYLSRGYGGREAGPLLVDPRKHGFRRVGDEPLMLCEKAPCWVAADRVAGAKAAAAEGAKCLILDDGYQDPSMRYDVSLLVVDGHSGFGAGRCIPAGPLREPVGRGLRRADAVVILGEDRCNVAKRLGDLPVLHARLETEAEAEGLAGQNVVAFAGIGRPAKFFHTLDQLGAKIVEAYSFPDHYRYDPGEIAELLALAERHAAALVTTTKDIVRIPSHLRDSIGVLTISVTWENEAALLRVLAPLVRRVGG